MSTRLLWGLLGVLSCAMAKAQSLPAVSLAATIKASQWQNRVLLVCAPTPEHPELGHQRQLLAKAQPALRERDLLVREAVFAHLPAPDQRYLRQQLGVAATEFTVLLIGKDGGVKQRATRPLTPEQLSAVIDAMPMRQQEMRRPK
ncbi:DUF4174 domain-containing protein [Hymenobacter sp. HSC-4F20]|uniref:DUF4174 domain-containing protein n=1 Tax=Hymenobacter sp. HSC-4F20 TaxID=2864135 RepID=UPI001C73CC58|nr:DUF4174 domain-containing protein [Hymenobacter sp. HSC-4F20]MBX0290841.1 DUF4174 domain-containing protein [Hymenobacter sp. HSC-4F20]